MLKRNSLSSLNDPADLIIPSVMNNNAMSDIAFEMAVNKNILSQHKKAIKIEN